MSAPFRIAGVAVLLLGSACARPTEVELRLHACPLDGAVPIRVDLEIRGLDAEGAALPVLEKSFEIDAASLADGYVTVGLGKPAGMVDADFVLTWHDADGGSESVELLRRPVPAAGEVLELGAEQCMPVGESSSSGEPGTSTGDTSTTDDTSSTLSMSSSSSMSGTSSSSSGEPDTGTSTSDDSSTTGTTTTGDTSSSTGDTDDTDSTTGEPSVIGMPCTKDVYYCEHGGPGKVGTMLGCPDGVYEVAVLEDACEFLFPINCAATVGLEMPTVVGCNGYGKDGLTCVCRDAEPQPCDMPTMCGPGKEITLCQDDHRVRAECSVACEDQPDGPVCVEE